MGFRVRAHFELLRFAAKIEMLEAVHHPIEGEIKRALDEIRRAGRTGSEEYAEHVSETSRLLIEELLGVAMAAAQVFLTAVRTRFVALARAYYQEFGMELTLGGMTFRANRGEIDGYRLFKLTGRLSTQVPFTPIEAINAVANYWKHHEEWPKTLKLDDEWRAIVWDDGKAKAIQKRAIQIVGALGMASSGVWNLQKAVKALGVRRNHDLTPVRRRLQVWAKSILKETEVQISVANNSIQRTPSKSARR